ncbi:GGDEF domain-containing protein [Corticibacter populi]|uniref:GGDEF domain-containing protein n=1 Tax=Corticibacter populi TaxID=1550736 RepID=UPI0010DC36E5|nr:GGDEF domain-containing protein [Corticibacter populi]RZS35771.1 diguanylate cyclase (GGDEF)-like protein [Corticibacter populi]
MKNARPRDRLQHALHLLPHASLLWLAALLAVALALSAAITLLAIQSTDASQAQRWQQRQQAQLQGMATMLGRHLERQLRLLQAFSQSLDADALDDPLALKSWAHQTARPASHLFDALWISPRPGSTHASAALLLQHGKSLQDVTLPAAMARPVALALASGQALMTDIVTADADAPLILMVSPVLDGEGLPRGVLAARFNPAALGLSPGEGSFPPLLPQLPLASQRFMVLSRNGAVLAQNAGPRIEGSGQPMLQAEAAVSQTGSVADIPGSPWRLAVEPPQNPGELTDEASAVSRRQWLIGGFALAAILLGTILLWWLWPLSRMLHRQANAASKNQTAIPAAGRTASSAMPSPAHHRSRPWQALHQLAEHQRYWQQSQAQLARLRTAQQRQCRQFTQLLEQSAACLAIVRAGNIEHLSAGGAQLLGLARGQGRGLPVAMRLAHPHAFDRLRSQMEGALWQRGVFTTAVLVCQNNGAALPLLAEIRPLEPHGQTLPQARLLVHAEPLAPAYRRLAGSDAAPAPDAGAMLLDELSLFPVLARWQALMEARLTAWSATAAHGTSAEAPQPAAPGHLLHVDVDGFSILCQSGGQALGNEALRCLASVLTDLLAYHLPGQALPARIARDSFVLACFDCDAEAAHRLARHIQEEASRTQASYLGQPIALSVSIGIAAMPTQADALADSLHAADLACYAATSRGGKGISKASAEHRQRSPQGRR